MRIEDRVKSGKRRSVETNHIILERQLFLLEMIFLVSLVDDSCVILIIISPY